MDQKYILGCPTVDNQHRQLWDMFSSFEEKLGLNTITVDDFHAMRQSLMDFAIVHFATEDVIMRKTSYPHFDIHIAEHQEFFGRIHTFFDDSYVGDLRKRGLDILLALNSWFFNHVLKSDADYVRHARSVNARICELCNVHELNCTLLKGFEKISD